MKITSTITTALLAIVLVCFFLPFAEISCNQQKFITLSGKDLIRGKEISEDMMKSFAKEVGKEAEYESSKNEGGMFSQANAEKDIPSNAWAVAAFLFIALGIVVGIIVKRFSTLTHLISASIALIALFGLQIELSNKYNQSGPFIGSVTSIKFQAGYWLALILSGFTAGISLVVFMTERRKNTTQSQSSEPVDSFQPPDSKL